eukprot:TRINITY_DN65568_c0_g1_i1.p1 TRINITY_DN65568_c0_g1~~TRINITY_DN65568_c0_g1_i1.p1  ORF type:complete len:289 (-),score=45.32 TRINITY_DN65568_c0_g1_i1:185-1051(-)
MAAGDQVFNDERPNNFHTMSLSIVIMCPTLMFVFISCSFAFVYHSSAVAVWANVALCVAIAGVFLLVRQTRQGTPMFWFNLGILCLVAVASAVYYGRRNFDRHFGVFWAYEGQRSYSNVSPDEPAASHLDAGRIVFTEGVRVDASRARAFENYCVAPIVGPKASAVVNYWSAGVGCCRSTEGMEFRCGEQSPSARSGLVYLDDHPAISGFRRAAASGSGDDAAKLGEEALFVQWVLNADKAQRSYYHLGVGSLIWTSVSYWALSILVGVCFHFGQRSRAIPGSIKRQS